MEKMISELGTSLVVQWLRVQAPNAQGLGSTPGQQSRSHMLQLRPSTTKYIYIFFKVKKDKWTQAMCSFWFGFFHLVLGLQVLLWDCCMRLRRPLLIAAVGYRIILDTLNLPRAISQLHISKAEREKHGNITEYP